MHVVTLNLQRDWRGGEHQVLLLARELQARGVRQTVVARAGSPLAARIAGLAGTEPTGGDISADTFASSRSVARVPISLLEAANPLDAFLKLPRRKGRPLIYHAHTGNTVPVAVLAAAWRRRVVITRHLDRPVRPWLYRRADRVVAVSPAVRDSLVAAGVAAERVRIIPTAIDLRRRVDPAGVARLRAAWKISAEGRVGLTVAAMSAEKDPLTLVRALPHLAADYRHVWVGDGPLRVEAAALARRLGVDDRLLLPGFDPEPEPWFGIASVFVLPSLWEAAGMAALDAFLFGVPVVASDVPGTRGLLDDGASCLRFPPGDDAALAAAVERLGEDRELAGRLAAEGKGRLPAYDIRATAAMYLELYRELSG
jgi:glycosyltransferase involved in cell wall biosynthesis